MKEGVIIVLSLLFISCAGHLDRNGTSLKKTGDKNMNENVTVVNPSAIEKGEILYCGKGYGMTPSQAYNKAKKAALVEMASSLATFVVSNSSTYIYDGPEDSKVVNRLKDEIFGLNLIVDHQVVKYEEMKEFGAYKCNVYISFSTEAARIIASERSEKILNDIMSEDKKNRSEKGISEKKVISHKKIGAKAVNDLVEGINFNDRGLSVKEISNTVFIEQIEKLVSDYDLKCKDDTLFVEDIPLGHGFNIRQGRIVPRRFSESDPVKATPAGAKLFINILSRTYFPSDNNIRFSLLSVEDHYCLYDRLGIKPYITGYLYKGDPEEPNYKFVLKFFNKKIETGNALMEFYSSAGDVGNFFIKVKL